MPYITTAAVNMESNAVKKHIRTGAIELHPTEPALLVSYQLESALGFQAVDPLLGQSKECQKIIRLKDLDNESIDEETLAREIVARCRLIPETRLGEVERLIVYLRQRLQGKPVPTRAVNGFISASSSSDLSVGKESANLSDLELYMEALYEDLPEKVRASGMILQLARQPQNLEILVENETLMGALARVLKEDWKKNYELTTNIVYIFFCFSTFCQFHGMISYFKIGALCMQIISYELKKVQAWKDELGIKTTNSSVQPAVIDPEDQDGTAKLKKFQALIRRQDCLLKVSVYLLLNLAEDLNTEVKMVRKGIVPLLVSSLSLDHSSKVLALVLTFLRKLSVFLENKNAMASEMLVEKLATTLVPGQWEDCTSCVLLLLYNLSFDLALRDKMVKLGLLPHIVALIESDQHRPTALSILYHFSADDKSKPMFSYTDCIPMIMKSISSSDEMPSNDAVALLVNLALHRRAAELIATPPSGDGLRTILTKAFDYRSPLLLKILKNMAYHEGLLQDTFVEFISDIASGIANLPEAMAVECVGILGTLTIANVDYALLFNEFNIVPWMQRKLDGSAEDDLVLELVILLGRVAADKSSAEVVIIQSGIAEMLVQLITDKFTDDEIILQTMCCFHQMLICDDFKPIISSLAGFRSHLNNLIHHKNKEIRKICDGCVDLVAAGDSEWADQVKRDRFCRHNAEWLKMLSEGDDGGGPEGDIYDESYLHDEDIVNTDLFEDLYGIQAEDILANYQDDRVVYSHLAK